MTRLTVGKMKASTTTVTTVVTFCLAFAAYSQEVLCPCKFDGNDDDTCRVYGQLGDDTLIPWYKASQDCLDAHNIKISAIPSFTLEGMCDPPNANAFTNYLKFESSAASSSIKQSYGQFWDGDANPITLVSTINGVDCKANANGCWTEIRLYFEANPDEIESNCQTFYKAAAKDLEAEQSTVRIAICNAETNAATACGALQTQVEQYKASNPNKACSAFGLGPVSGGSESPPNCDGAPSPAPPSSTGGHQQWLVMWSTLLSVLSSVNLCMV